MQNSSGQQFKVKHDSPLLKYLFELFPDQSKTGVKQMLSKGRVLVNDRQITAFDQPLFAGDTLLILKKGISIARESAATATNSLEAAGVKVIYEDEKLLVVDKPSSLLVTAPVGEKVETTLYSLVQQYVRMVTKASRKEDILSGREVDRTTKKAWLVHRMERGASGLIIFAKDERTKDLLQSKWDTLIEEHSFTAYLEGEVYPSSGTIETWIVPDEKARKLVSYPTDEIKESKREVSFYKTIDYIRKSKEGKVLFTVVTIGTRSRRPDVLRSQAEFIGHPIAGDGKYGAYWDPFERLALHSSTLVFHHPYSGKTVRCISPLPEVFNKKIR